MTQPIRHVSAAIISVIVTKAVGNTSITVELDALFNSTVSPTQTFAWEDLRPMYVRTTLVNMRSFSFHFRTAEEQAPITNPNPRPRTPAPGPACEPPWASTPEPEGSMSPLPHALVLVN